MDPEFEVIMSSKPAWAIKKRRRKEKEKREMPRLLGEGEKGRRGQERN